MDALVLYRSDWVVANNEVLSEPVPYYNNPNGKQGLFVHVHASIGTSTNFGHHSVCVAAITTILSKIYFKAE